MIDALVAALVAREALDPGTLDRFPSLHLPDYALVLVDIVRAAGSSGWRASGIPVELDELESEGAPIELLLAVDALAQQIAAMPFSDLVSLGSVEDIVRQLYRRQVLGEQGARRRSARKVA
jgi:hypothetical protein